MRKLIASINMTLDGFCDHTAMISDNELHQHYDELLSLFAGTLLETKEIWWSQPPAAQ